MPDVGLAHAMRRLLSEVMERIEVELLWLMPMCAAMAATRLSAAAWAAAEWACEECGGRVDSIESVHAQEERDATDACGERTAITRSATPNGR